MLLWILIMWVGFSVACGLVVGKFIASVERKWSREEVHQCLENPSGPMEIPFTLSAEPRQMAVEAAAR
ncbi:MAG TPA: hypothetical protein VLX12_02320 [Syntrophorhabdales bacterium]|nr:hypothetical protein [Syntrophorhabdales bacterium]